MKEFSIDDAVIDVARGEEFRISAPAVPTGGFRWLWECDDSRMEEVDQRFDLPSGSVGGATVQHLVFRAGANGVFHLRLRYQQAGASSAREERSFTVSVTDAD